MERTRSNYYDKTVTAQVNNSNSSIEVEIQYDKTLVRATSIVIDKQNYDIQMITNTGSRDELLLLKIKGKDNEHKSIKGGKTTKLSK